MILFISGYIQKLTKIEMIALLADNNRIKVPLILQKYASTDVRVLHHYMDSHVDGANSTFFMVKS